MNRQLPEPIESTATAMAGKDGTILWTGTGFAELLGSPGVDLVGRRLHEVLGKAGFWSSQAFDLAVGSMSRQVCRVEIPTPQAGALRLRLSFEPLAMDRTPVPTMAILAQRLADDFEAQALVQAQAQRYQLIFQHSLDGILYGTENGPILEANPAACEMLGASAEELRSMRRQDVTDLTDPRLPERLAERRRNSTARGVLTMIRKDGTRFECELSSSLWRAASGEMEAVTLMRDLTERHALEQRVRELQRLDALGTLAGGLAHDFNNIVATIVGNVVLARGHTDEGHASRPMLEEIDKAAERARRLVEQLMIFSQKRHQTLEVLSLRPVIERGLTTLRSMLPGSIRIHSELPEEPLYARLNSGGLLQVLINLGSNSEQAMSGKQGTIDVLVDRVELEFSQAEQLGSTHAGAYARIRFRDDGCGFDNAVRERLFDPFFTTRELGRNTGMGLALIHGIVRDHGGMIVADGTPGLGAEFTIYLPLVQQEPLAQPLEEPPASGTQVVGQGRRLVYIDDDESLVTLVCLLLKRAGFDVRGFTEPQAALDEIAMAAGEIDMVVTDFNMPGLSGLDVTSALKTIRPELAVVIVSGYVTEGLHSKAQALGVRAVLYKETSVRDFCSTVAQLLESS